MASVALQSKAHRDLLDIIDRLRSKGTGRYVDLPQIIVCGDQSAGKSSVLEAISGFSFPIKDDLGTRFATELVLRRDAQPGSKLSIIPAPDRAPEEKESLSAFNFETSERDLNLGDLVENAKGLMGISATKEFSNDTLRVELSGPTQPHLTLVDLPGLFCAGNKNQSVGGAKLVRTMVEGYMKRPRSIILAVVSAKSDFALQEITELARELDPDGTRTMGLITKPDTLDVGSDSELSYLKLAKNEDVVFRLGWHVLRNRNYEERNDSNEHRDKKEEEFFASGVWSSLPFHQVGVKSLRPRLSNILKDQILSQLPGLIEDVEDKISECKSRLDRLGEPRKTLQHQREFLIRASQDFSNLVQAAIDGHYDVNPKFFGNPMRDVEGYKRRLRAVIQNTLQDFETKMHDEGQAQVITDPTDNESVKPSKRGSRKAYIKKVEQLMRRSRGRELPGTFNPLIIGDLFMDQCRPWNQIAQKTKTTIIEAVYDALQDIVDHLSLGDHVAGSVLGIIHRGIEDLHKNLDITVADLVSAHMKRHPITYNHYLTDNVQKAQAERRRRKLENTLKQAMGHRSSNDDSEIYSYEVNIQDVVNALAEQTEIDMQTYASELAVDYMQAYYKVAIKKFTNNFADTAIEGCFIANLPKLFCPTTVSIMTDDEISHLAAESEETTAQRKRDTDQRIVLEAAMSDLRLLDKRRSRKAITVDTTTGNELQTKSWSETESDDYDAEPPSPSVEPLAYVVYPDSQLVPEPQSPIPSPVAEDSPLEIDFEENSWRTIGRKKKRRN